MFVKGHLLSVVVMLGWLLLDFAVHFRPDVWPFLDSLWEEAGPLLADVTALVKAGLVCLAILVFLETLHQLRFLGVLEQASLLLVFCAGLGQARDFLAAFQSRAHVTSVFLLWAGAKALQLRCLARVQRAFFQDVQPDHVISCVASFLGSLLASSLLCVAMVLALNHLQGHQTFWMETWFLGLVLIFIFK